MYEIYVFTALVCVASFSDTSEGADRARGGRHGRSGERSTTRSTGDPSRPTGAGRRTSRDGQEPERPNLHATPPPPPPPTPPQIQPKPLTRRPTQAPFKSQAPMTMTSVKTGGFETSRQRQATVVQQPTANRHPFVENPQTAGGRRPPNPTTPVVDNYYNSTGRQKSSGATQPPHRRPSVSAPSSTASSQERMPWGPRKNIDDDLSRRRAPTPPDYSRSKSRDDGRDESSYHPSKYMTKDNHDNRDRAPNDFSRHKSKSGARDKSYFLPTISQMPQMPLNDRSRREPTKANAQPAGRSQSDARKNAEPAPWPGPNSYPSYPSGQRPIFRPPGAVGQLTPLVGGPKYQRRDSIDPRSQPPAHIAFLRARDSRQTIREQFTKIDTPVKREIITRDLSVNRRQPSVHETPGRKKLLTVQTKPTDKMPPPLYSAPPTYYGMPPIYREPLNAKNQKVGQLKPKSDKTGGSSAPSKIEKHNAIAVNDFEPYLRRSKSDGFSAIQQKAEQLKLSRIPSFGLSILPRISGVEAARRKGRKAATETQPEEKKAAERFANKIGKDLAKEVFDDWSEMSKGEQQSREIAKSTSNKISDDEHRRDILKHMFTTGSGEHNESRGRAATRHPSSDNAGRPKSVMRRPSSGPPKLGKSVSFSKNVERTVLDEENDVKNWGESLREDGTDILLERTVKVLYAYEDRVHLDDFVLLMKPPSACFHVIVECVLFLRASGKEPQIKDYQLKGYEIPPGFGCEAARDLASILRLVEASKPLTDAKEIRRAYRRGRLLIVQDTAASARMPVAEPAVYAYVAYRNDVMSQTSRTCD